MSPAAWTELYALAERRCPAVLTDLPALAEADALGVLTWLRRLDREAAK